MPPRDESDPVVGMTYGEMIRAVYVAVVGGLGDDRPGLLERVRLLEQQRVEEAEQRRRITENRIAILATGLGCGFVPTIVVLLVEHYWK